MIILPTELIQHVTILLHLLNVHLQSLQSSQHNTQGVVELRLIRDDPDSFHHCSLCFFVHFCMQRKANYVTCVSLANTINTVFFMQNFDNDYRPPPSLPVQSLRLSCSTTSSHCVNQHCPILSVFAYVAFHHSFFGSCMGERWGGPGNEPSSCMGEGGPGNEPSSCMGEGGPGNEPSSCTGEGGPGNEPTLLPKVTSFISGLKMTWLLLILLTIYTWLTYSCPHTTVPSYSTSLCDPSEEQWLT